MAFHKFAILAAMLFSISAAAKFDIFDDLSFKLYVAKNYSDLNRSLYDGTYEDKKNDPNSNYFIGETISDLVAANKALDAAFLMAARFGHFDETPQLNLTHADLSFGKFKNADLSMSDLRGARAQFADFRRAVLSCAMIEGTDFFGSSFSGAKIILGNGQAVPVTKHDLRTCGALAQEIRQGVRYVEKTWQAKRQTWYSAPFYMKSTGADGHRHSNLFATGGALEQYGQLVDSTQAREHELKEHFFPHDDSDPLHALFGYSHLSNQISRLLEQPKKAVNIRGVDFSVRNIEGLLISVVEDLVSADPKDMEFKGSRHDNADYAADNFLFDLMAILQSDEPFSYDIVCDSIPFNFVCDRVEVYRSDEPPLGFDPSSLSNRPLAKEEKYFTLIFHAAGQPQPSEKFHLMVGYDANDTICSSHWLQVRKHREPPIMMWRSKPIGDIMHDKNLWRTTERAHNPYVDAQVVYDIYQESLKD